MKNYFLLLLGVTGFFLAQGRESNTPVEKNSGSRFLSKNSRHQAELQLATQIATSTPFQRAVKKIPIGSELVSDVLTGSTFYIVSLPTVNNSLHSKSYLTHIHPTHHFW